MEEIDAEKEAKRRAESEPKPTKNGSKFEVWGSSGRLGALPGFREAPDGLLGSSWGPLGVLLGSSGAVLGPSGAPSWSQVGDQNAPKMSQKHVQKMDRF